MVKEVSFRRDRFVAMEEAARRGDVVAISKLLTDELVEAQERLEKLKDGSVWVVTRGITEHDRFTGRVVAIKGSALGALTEVGSIVRRYPGNPGAWIEDKSHCAPPVQDWVNESTSEWIRITPWGVT